MGRGQGCCETSYNAQDSTPSAKMSTRAEVEKACLEQLPRFVITYPLVWLLV